MFETLQFSDKGLEVGQDSKFLRRLDNFIWETQGEEIKSLLQEIEEKLIDYNIDIIGLSGLITPSLDEMVYVAKQMQEQDFHLPLMIGGATTSKAHTAVKIEPNYQNDLVVYVSDASRSVGVATTLLSKDKKADFIRETREEYAQVRQRLASRKPKAAKLSYLESVENGFKYDWENYTPPVPKITGQVVFDDYPLEKILPYVDWTPFFISWGLVGKYPKIFDDDVVGTEAKELFANAQAMIQKAQRIAPDTVAVYNQNDVETYRFEHLRQQSDKVTGKPNYSLADFISPKDNDYLGGFTVSIFGADELSSDYKARGDDYNAIMVQAVCDRFAEAFAEHLHAMIRRDYWAYQSDENLSNDDLIKEKYIGIRPAPGYPACPEHTEKGKLFAWLGTTAAIGTFLTESYAMWPPSSVSGFYYSHPDSTYFNVGKINQDQLEDYAKRKDWDMATAKKWLNPNL